MRELGYGGGYAYDHAAPDAFSGQNYFPDGMKRETYYRPTQRGYERDIAERLARWSELRRNRAGGEGSSEP
jgi:putative ATPase